MKKRVFAIFAAVAVMAAGVFGCGGSEDYSKCITLGQYMGIEVTAIDTSVSDEELQEEIDFMFHVDVRDGDYINLDFTGYIDGETFEGGSTDGAGYDLLIGSGSFIDGFEDGLIGAKAGDAVTLNLTFPEDYSDALGGKDVVFECTINEIYYTTGAAELTEEFVKENTAYDSIEAYRESVREGLIATKEEEARSTQLSELYQQLLNDCDVKKFPEKLLEEQIQEAEDYYNYMLDYYIQFYYYYYSQSFTREQMLTILGTTQEEFDAEVQESGETSAKSIMIMTVIAEKEGITLSDSEFEEALEGYIVENGVDSADEFYEQTGYTEETLREDCLFDKTLEYLLDNAVFVE